MTPTTLLADVELAILANGGFAHRKEWCKCDPSVGMTPCEYCAIHRALDRAFHYFSDELAAAAPTTATKGTP